MNGYPAELARRHRLLDGTEILVRPVRAEDENMEQDFVRHLSPETRYKRFLATLKELPAADLHYLTHIDYTRHLALIATVAHDDHEVAIGSARYVLGPDGVRGEFAIVIDDAWQGRGVAGVLMHDLIQAARTRGLETLEGFVLATNQTMLKFVRQLGFSVETVADDPELVRVALRL